MKPPARLVVPIASGVIPRPSPNAPRRGPKSAVARNRRTRRLSGRAVLALVVGAAVFVELAVGVAGGPGSFPDAILHAVLLIVVAAFAVSTWATGTNAPASAEADLRMDDDPTALVALAAHVVGGHCGALLVPAPTPGSLVVSATFGSAPYTARPVPSRKGAVGACLAIGRPLRIAQLPDHGDTLPYRTGDHGITSVLCIPIATPTGLGVLCIERRGGDPFSEEDGGRLEPLVPVAQQILSLRESARSQQDVAGRSTRSMEALRSVAEARTQDAAVERLLAAAKAIAGCEHATWIPASLAVPGSLVSMCMSERLALPAGGVTRGTSVALRAPDDPWTRTSGTPARAIPVLPDPERGDLPALGALCLAGGPPGCLADDVVAVILPVAEAAGAALAKLEQLRAAELAATTDPLTELPNRGAFASQLAERITSARVGGAGLALLMLDVDHFKRVNDTFGHPAGDAVLRAVAATLQDGVRRDDLAARWGGEEFAVILSGVPIETALVLADRLRSTIAGVAMPVTTADGPLHVTVSVGVATFGPMAATPDELVAAADRALYDAKQTGRNRVVAA